MVKSHAMKRHTACFFCRCCFKSPGQKCCAAGGHTSAAAAGERQRPRAAVQGWICWGSLREEHRKIMETICLTYFPAICKRHIMETHGFVYNTVSLTYRKLMMQFMSPQNREVMVGCRMILEIMTSVVGQYLQLGFVCRVFFFRC